MAAQKILLATPSSDQGVQLLGWLSRLGFYVGLVSELSKLNDIKDAEDVPDCVVLDDTLTAKSLSYVIKTLRAEPQWTRALVVVIGTFTEEQEVDLFHNGADEVLSKPIRAGALYIRIKRLLVMKNGK